MIFQDRKHAGRLLADQLLKYKEQECMILALPRGGVPVAAEIATALNAPLDVLIVRKIGAPFQSELAVGALCEDEKPIWSETLLSRMGLEPDNLSGTVQAEKNKIQQQTRNFRKGRRLPAMAKKIVIVVDDGLATGATVSAAVKYLKKKGAAKIVVAVPVGAASSAQQLRDKVDEVVILEERLDLSSVGQWYEDFSQVSDEEVLSFLKGSQRTSRHLEIPVGQVKLAGDLTTFPAMKALIVFVHGSGSSRKSPRNQQVARDLNEAGFGTFLFDLLTDEEAKNRKNVFDIKFLSARLVAVTRWLRQQPGLEKSALGYFGASTGAAAAIQAASKFVDKEGVYAIVGRGGRPDLAGEALELVKVPILLLVGGYDFDVIELNRQAQELLRNSKLSIIPKATHLFEEPGTLEEVSRQAVQWFNDHLKLKKSRAQTEASASLDGAIESAMMAMRNEDDLD